MTVLLLSVNVTRFLLLIFSCASGPICLYIPAFNIKLLHTEWHPDKSGFSLMRSKHIFWLKFTHKQTFIYQHEHLWLAHTQHWHIIYVCTHTHISKSTHMHTCRSGFIVPVQSHTNTHSHMVVSVERPERWQHCWQECYQVSVNTHIISTFSRNQFHAMKFYTNRKCRAVNAAIIGHFFLGSGRKD